MSEPARIVVRMLREGGYEVDGGTEDERAFVREMLQDGALSGVDPSASTWLAALAAGLANELAAYRAGRAAAASRARGGVRCPARLKA